MSKSRRNGPKKGGKTKRRRHGGHSVVSKLTGTTSSRVFKSEASSHLTKAHMVITFLEVLNHVKLYHWKTKQYAEHKATDELYGKLNEDIDKFVEVLLGKDGSRIATVKQIRVCDTIHTTQSLRKKMEKFKDFLMRLNDSLDAHKDSDLLNIRDEILADINQFLYLLTFR
jgi:DNA-binding ferritin-like protein